MERVFINIYYKITGATPTSEWQQVTGAGPRVNLSLTSPSTPLCLLQDVE